MNHKAKKPDRKAIRRTVSIGNMGMSRTVPKPGDFIMTTTGYVRVAR